MERITFLGTSGSVVTKDRMCAGLLFRDKLIDVGFGVLTNLIQSGTKLDSINEVYVSHAHSDHIGDFTGLIWAMAMENRTRPLRVVSSKHTGTILTRVLDLQATPRSWLKFSIDFVRPKDVDVTNAKTVHDPETLAYRFQNNGSDFVYGADTAASRGIGQFAEGSDLLIHEATFLQGQESIAALTNHSTATDAGQAANVARVRKLVLTHISPSNSRSERKYVAQARKVFDGEIIVARDNLTISV